MLWYPVFLAGFSLMPSNIEDLYMCLFAIHISLVNCSTYPFSNWVLVFLLLDLGSSLYILDMSPLMDMRFANIFSQLVT